MRKAAEFTVTDQITESPFTKSTISEPAITKQGQRSEEGLSLPELWQLQGGNEPANSVDGISRGAWRGVVAVRWIGLPVTVVGHGRFGWHVLQQQSSPIAVEERESIGDVRIVLQCKADAADIVDQLVALGAAKPIVVGSNLIDPNLPGARQLKL